MHIIAASGNFRRGTLQMYKEYKSVKRVRFFHVMYKAIMDF